MDFQDMFSVTGKVVCVTGGGGGIGRGIAGVFAAGGARVYIASRSDLTAVAEELTEKGSGECIPLQADLAKDEDIPALAKAFEERDGKLDVLVNNAALGNCMGRFGEFDMGMWDTVTRVNQRAPFALTQACRCSRKQEAAARTLRSSTSLPWMAFASPPTTIGPTPWARPL